MQEYREDMCKFASARIWAVYVLSILACLVLATGCDSGPEKMADPKASLEKLAEEYWNKRLIAKDYKATFKMELEEESIPFEEYIQRVHNQGQIPYKSIKTKEVKIDNDTGSVELILKYTLPGVTKELGAPIHDTWIIKSNQWKHILPKK